MEDEGKDEGKGKQSLFLEAGRQVIEPDTGKEKDNRIPILRTRTPGEAQGKRSTTGNQYMGEVFIMSQGAWRPRANVADATSSLYLRVEFVQ